VPKVAIDVGSVLSSNIVNRVTSFVVYAVVARQIGIDAFAGLALASSVSLIAGRVTGLGIQPVVVRRVARDPESVGRVLVTAIPPILVAWSAGWLILEPFLRVMGYPSQVGDVVRVMYVAALGFAVGQMCEGMFLAIDPAWIPRVNVPIWLGQTGIALWLMYGPGVGIIVVAVSIAAAQVLIGAISSVVLWRLQPPDGRASLAETVALVRESRTFLATNTANTLATSGTLVVVSTLGTQTEVALFAAAQQLFTPAGLLAEAAASTFYPRIVRRLRAPSGSNRFVELSIEALLAMVIPAAVGLLLLAQPLLVAVFGRAAFGGGASVIRILALGLIARGLSLLYGQVLFAGDDERASLRFAVVRAVFVLGASWILMSLVGIIGAAVAVLLASLLNWLMHHSRVRRRFGKIDLIHAVIPSLTASAVMSIVLAMTPLLPVAGMVGVGVATYGAVIVVVYRFNGRIGGGS